MSLAYPDRAGPLSTCPGKFPENVRVPCPRVHNTVHTNFLKNLGIKTPKLVLFELGTTADCTAVDLLVHSSTRVRKIPSTYPDCNTRWIYTTASQGLIGGFTFSTFYIRMGVLFTMGVLPPCILHVYIIPFAEQENYNRPGERSF